ncbi:MAG TPA: tetratricopeptide repeat protein [Terriglobales bacterium]|nr:tetratricopeptide repeat protein [Terriglobales bacterium]
MPDTAKRADRAEIAKRVDRAEKFLQKGKTADALDEFLTILLEDPENDSVRQMAADLCLSLNRTQEAIKLLGQLFERQVAANDTSRASLTYKRLARLVNPSYDQKFRFAQLIETSNKKLALETYESVLADQAKLELEQEALATLKAMVNLDPNEKNLLKLGELSSKLGQKKEAAEAFARVAEAATAAGQDAQQWYERAYTEDSSDPNVVLQYGNGLMKEGQIGAAIFVFEPAVHAGGATVELRDAYARALLGANRLADAEPVIWELFEQHPARAQQVLDLIAAMIDSKMDAEAVALAKKLEQFQRKRGERKIFVAQMQELVNKHRAAAEVLEFMGELFNSSNREADYSQTLLKLFDLYCENGNFAKAGECLDRAAEVDPYESGHQKRLQMLKGKIDENRFQVIASRFSSATSSSAEQEKKPDHTLGNAALQDLMLQAEILVQYGMRSKAIERLQRIQELFPHEEERNEDLQRLYLSAGMTPRYSGAAPVLPVEIPSITPSAPAAPAAASSDMSSFTRVAEITRKLYKQSTANNVLTTAVNEIGAQWKVTRCIAAMRKPGLPPTAVQEYCTEGVRSAEASPLAKLVSFVHEFSLTRGTLNIPDALASSDLQPIRDLIGELAVTSLLAVPLMDGSEHTGLLLLLQATPRTWNSSDVVVLKTIAEQMTIALNNVGLRRLVKNLSVTDERSGLLNRASYLDLLQAETRRALQQATPLTVMLMQFGKGMHLAKELGEQGLESVMEQIGKMVSANIRQNDLAFRYAPATLALVLGETAEKEGLLALEKLRKLLAEIRVPGKDQPVTFSAGLAQAVLKQNYDSVDIVTEVINRAEQALDASRSAPNKVAALPPGSAAAAVA